MVLASRGPIAAAPPVATGSVAIGTTTSHPRSSNGASFTRTSWPARAARWSTSFVPTDRMFSIYKQNVSRTTFGRESSGLPVRNRALSASNESQRGPLKFFP